MMPGPLYRGTCYSCTIFYGGDKYGIPDFQMIEGISYKYWFHVYIVLHLVYLYENNLWVLCLAVCVLQFNWWTNIVSSNTYTIPYFNRAMYKM